MKTTDAAARPMPEGWSFSHDMRAGGQAEVLVVRNEHGEKGLYRVLKEPVTPTARERFRRELDILTTRVNTSPSSGSWPPTLRRDAVVRLRTRRPVRPLVADLEAPPGDGSRRRRGGPGTPSTRVGARRLPRNRRRPPRHQTHEHRRQARRRRSLADPDRLRHRARRPRRAAHRVRRGGRQHAVQPGRHAQPRGRRAPLAGRLRPRPDVDLDARRRRPEGALAAARALGPRALPGRHRRGRLDVRPRLHSLLFDRVRRAAGRRRMPRTARSTVSARAGGPTTGGLAEGAPSSARSGGARPKTC